MIHQKTLPYKIQLRRVSWIVVFPIWVIVLLVMSFISSEALASSVEPASGENISSLNLQITDPATSTLQIESTSNDGESSPTLQSVGPVTPSVRIELTPTETSTSTLQIGSTSTYSFTLATLDYEETILTSPFGKIQYQFRVPENWLIQTDSLLELDLSYIYSQVVDDTYPAFLGDLTITLNGETLTVFQIDERELDHYRLRVPLPASLLREPGQVQTIGVVLEAGFLCEVPHKASLIIHPTSFITLNYGQRPPVLDLARYPRPFYQRAFEPDSVRFVLPSQPTSADAASALAIAAKLGDLTGNRLVISATTDVELSQLVPSASSTFGEHLIIVGRPQDNQLLPLLNDIVELPVSLHERQLELITQGPTVVVPGNIFTYTFTITNTIDRAVDLSLINPLPPYTELIACTDCAKDINAGTVSWPNNLLTPDETFSMSLTLKASDIITGGIVENTVTLVEADLGPINADTLVSTIVGDLAKSELQSSVAGPEGYFFTYNDQAVAKGDGIIQEILSPWNESRVILIITGLSDEAVRKASQVMSSEVHFPGMNGPVALVRDALPPSEIDDIAATTAEMTFADLGYEDIVFRGEGLQQANIDFQVPFGWQLTKDAFIDLHFSHSQLLDYADSGLTGSINNRPVASIALNNETAGDGNVQINLAETRIRTGQDNRLNIQVTMPERGCEDPGPGPEQNWVVINSNSKIFLAHQEDTESILDLERFPYPFQTNRALTDLLFVLPDAPTADEWEDALNMAANLGRSAAGKTLLPAAVIGGDLSAEELANYHIIAMGRPSRNGLIQEVNPLLPQPFLPGSDEIEQRLDDVIFRLPTDFSLGYIQLIPSPWDEAYALLAVTGTTNDSVGWAVDTLINRSRALEGNLALITVDQVNTIDTRRLTSDGTALAVVTAVPEMTEDTVAVAATPTPLPLPTPTPSLVSVEQTSKTAGRPAWLIPVIGVNGLIVLGIFATVIWQARKKRVTSIHDRTS